MEVRELTRDDWRLIAHALDMLQRVRMGQWDVVFQEFVDHASGSEHLSPRRRRDRWDLAHDMQAIAEFLSVFLFGHPYTSLPGPALDDPLCRLLEQARLRCCPYAGRWQECPKWPNDCWPTRPGFCPGVEGNRGKG